MKSFALSLFLGLALAVAAPGAPSATPCPPGLSAPVGWDLFPMPPCEGRETRLLFHSCQECTDILSAELLSSGGVRVQTRGPEVCPRLACTPDTAVVSLGLLAAGYHSLVIEVVGEIVFPDSSVCTVVRHDTLTFFVSPDCIPLPGPLPYVDAICIGAPDRCDPATRVACPDAPIPVFFAGHFPSDCFTLERVELVLSRSVLGPFIRIVVDDNACLGRPCIEVPVPWSAQVNLPPALPGAHQVPVVLEQVSCADSDTTPPHHRWTQLVPYTVAERCSIPVFHCLLWDWAHPFGPGSRCDAFLTPEHPARATLEIRSSAPLAGLQGKLRLQPPALRIVALAPVGPAEGMHLDWNPTPDGADFVMFAESGAPIPATLRDSVRHDVPVLEVSVAPGVYAARGPSGPEVPPVTLLFAQELLGSDSLGGAVPPCPTLLPLMPAARICTSRACDFNHDGVADVRDLVIMVHCVLQTGFCPDTLDQRFDCNGDGTNSLDDVLCCARVILHGGMPDSGQVHPEPGVSLRFGTPVRTATGYEVPASLLGADRLGAARLALRYPSDRFELEDVRFGGDAAAWLQLFEPGDGEVLVGLIGIGTGGGAELPFTLRLRLKSGQEPGGQVTVTSGDFSAPDGAGLRVDLGQPEAWIGETPRVALSAAQPNPFSGETRFSVTLPRAAEVELAVHDLGGRRVAALFRGRLPGGSREFAWNGRADGGEAAPNGVYFLRLAAGGQVVSKKLALLRGD